MTVPWNVYSIVTGIEAALLFFDRGLRGFGRIRRDLNRIDAIQRGPRIRTRFVGVARYLCFRSAKIRLIRQIRVQKKARSVEPFE